MRNQFLRLRGTGRNASSASAVPPAIGPKNFLISFSALDGAVVSTVNFEDWAVGPLRATEAGFRLQVGISFTPLIAVVMLQLRSTVPIKPLVPTTTIFPVFPEVAPGATEIEVVPPEPAVKLGTAFTVTEKVAVCVIFPVAASLAVTVAVYPPAGVEDEVLTVSAEVTAEVPVMLAEGAKQVRPVGELLTEQLNLTVPVNPPEGVTDIVVCVDSPAETVAEEGLTLRA